MNDPKQNTLKEKADELRRRLDYSPELPKTDHDEQEGPPTPRPKTAFASFCTALTEVFSDKTAGKLVETLAPKREAEEVRRKVEEKYPNLLKKKAMLTAAAQTFTSKEAAGLLQRLASNPHKAELAGLGILAVPGIDSLQAHGRAALARDYNKAGVKKREVLPHVAHPLAETVGLGVLAAPSIAHLRGH